jgi:putative salt-induced outer membrane protein YdiY
MESGSNNTLFTDTLALTVKMSDRLALSLAYTLQDNTKPPAGLKKTDTTETVNRVFAL